MFKINADGTSGELLRVLTSEDLDESVTFDVPTTVARFGNSLYLPNARFGTVSDPSAAEYWITRAAALQAAVDAALLTTGHG